QHLRRIVPALLCEGDARPEQMQLRSLEIAQRSTFGVRGERDRFLDRARLVLRLSGCELALGPTSRVECQDRGALEERGGRGEPAPRLRSCRRAIQLRGD